MGPDKATPLYAGRGAAFAVADCSDQVRDADTISPLGDDDLGVLTIVQITMKCADPVTPTHLIPGTPNVTYAGLWGRPPGTPLTCFARLSGRQSLPTGHLAPLWKGLVWRLPH
jgi:hypothetical protein